jgi:phosphopantothenoylcysteine decarboxylase/phosphopantothenate--cysteine ligase
MLKTNQSPASLTNKQILVGITGGIAAYKSAELVRRLQDVGADVRVVMTRAATEFITPLTLQALSGHPVSIDLLDTESEQAMGHIDLARWADAIVIAPASANFIAKLAQGKADDLLSTICLASAAAVAVAPAMNQQMWANQATQDNLATLSKRNIKQFGPGVGDQACGDVGAGRMLEAEELTQLTSELFQQGQLQDLKVVITAGPTWEAIDAIRGLSNRSSGRMGYAIAEATMEAGAKVTLVSGPTSLQHPARVMVQSVQSAEEMLQAVLTHIEGADIFIGVAAVADYRPEKTSTNKVKSTTDNLTLELVKNPDILATVSALQPRPFTVGFAAESHDLENYAREKLKSKNLDLIAANPILENGVGFESNENKILLIDRQENITSLEQQPKTKLARILINHISKKYHAQNTTKNSRQASR